MLRSRRLAPPRSLLLVAALTAAAACGGDDDGGGGGIDGGPGGGDAATADGPPPLCTDFVAEDLGALDPLPGAASEQEPQMDPPAGNADAKILRVHGTAANGEKPDVLVIELWDGYGAFEGGDVETGTFTIEGDETVVLSCGICVFVYADATLVDGEPVDREKEYIATGGSITIDSVATNFTGSLSDLVLSEIDPKDENGAPLEGGCQTASSSVTFDAPITIEE